MITREMYLLAKKVVENYEKQQLDTPVILPGLFKERRLFLKLSMQDVTNETDISKSTISRIERGNDAFFETIMILDRFYTSKEI